ncbi:MAG: Uncharacterized protein FD145_1188 [Candidatus Saganbacteria bacterium]|uniref:DUF4325 domain-containing protein n=1 Tax=Candidatus Saganbacteria bacterium TaxID=2575572 RepID=A0A833NWQ1_UNCSA|nr:MAG: Uncharacterized protein FD145_1188 [Candidatus Saganbacteria bacterium]
MKHIKIFDKAGSFAENKDIAKTIRIKEIVPAIEAKEDVVLDFDKVDTATQSFIHALISDVIRKQGNDVLDCITFKACNNTIKQLINIVVEYMQNGN